MIWENSRIQHFLSQNFKHPVQKRLEEGAGADTPGLEQSDMHGASSTWMALSHSWSWTWTGPEEGSESVMLTGLGLANRNMLIGFIDVVNHFDGFETKISEPLCQCSCRQISFDGLLHLPFAGQDSTVHQNLVGFGSSSHPGMWPVTHGLMRWDRPIWSLARALCDRVWQARLIFITMQESTCGLQCHWWQSI